MSASQVAFYAGLKKTGWSRCPRNYDVYSFEVPAESAGLSEGGMLVLPGLRVKGSPRANERMTGVQALVDKGYVVRHVEQVLSASRYLADRFDQITRQNIHEIKGINSGIYHAALRLEDLTRRSEKALETSLAGNISALSQILTARTDYMTFLADSSLSGVEYGPVHVYRTFDRMHKCFADRAEKSRVRVSMAGTSFSRSFGPRNLLDVAAYILVDNAVKYSPEDEQITVRVNDVDEIVKVSIESVGPILLEGEADAIFEKDFRSENAIKTGVTGTGIGLHALKSVIIPAFGGDIRVSSGSRLYESAGVEFGPISFQVTLPIIES